jgi:DNA-binding MarR family transcriptional regulator
MVDTAKSKARTLTERDFREQADFRYAMRRFSRFSELQARREGITPQQHLVLLLIRGHPSYPEVSIGEIAERMQIKHHSASLLIERTLQRGLVTRQTDEVDRRRALVSLTDEGQRILDRITLANRRELGAMDPSLFRSSFVEGVQNRSPEQ